MNDSASRFASSWGLDRYGVEPSIRCVVSCFGGIVAIPCVHVRHEHCCTLELSSTLGAYVFVPVHERPAC